MSNKASDKAESAYLSLPPKRRDFVDAYFECKFNGTQAALKAGYSPKTAMTQAEQLLRKLEVKAAIEERRAEIEAANRLRADEVVEELRKIGFSDITKILSWKKNVITVTDSADLPPGISACISEISEVPTKDGSIIKIKLHNKIAALEMLGRYLKMFADKEDLDKSKDIKSAVKDIAAAILRDCQPAPEAKP